MSGESIAFAVFTAVAVLFCMIPVIVGSSLREAGRIEKELGVLM